MSTLKTRLLESLVEDCPSGDITTEWFAGNNHPTLATITAKESGVFFGESVIKTLFSILDPNATITLNTHDGALIHTNDIICTIKSSAHTLLKGERVLLNLLQRGSGVASLTHAFVHALNDPKIKVLDTRKTTPLWREFEREAVRAGGGHNHRFCLSDMVLIKENHLAELEKQNQLHLLGDLMKAFKEQHPNSPIEIEIETLQQLESWDLSLADVIMLDHFSLDDLYTAADICTQRQFKAELEVSGNINLNSIVFYRHTPIHRISVGTLTHSAPALDLSMRIMV
jgi:nicotinate-nucleotide pyrophosphorylase (carboxylating)